MNWKVVKISGENRGKNTPYASIGHNALNLNAAACDLIENYEDYGFVELLEAEENKKTFVGVKFCRESTNDTIKVARTKYKDKLVKGITIANKNTLTKLFGKDRVSGSVTRFPVNKDKDADNILVISL